MQSLPHSHGREPDQPSARRLWRPRLREQLRRVARWLVPRSQELSLRQRLTRQAAWAVLALVWGFGAIVWGGTAWHLYRINRSAAVTLSQSLLPAQAGGRAKALALLQDFDRRSDPEVWLLIGSAVYTSPNVPSRVPPPVGMEGWSRPNPRLVVESAQGAQEAVVAWPIGPVFEVLRDLATVLVLGGLLAGLMGAWLARWATRRMLVPVDRMVAAVTAMVERRQVSALPFWSDVDDEFNRLSQVLNTLLRQLTEQAARERELLAHAAHELRTPLQVLQGHLELLENALDPRQAGSHESLEQSQQVLRRLTRLVTDLLTLERAQHPSGYTPERVPLAPLVAGVADDARALAETRRQVVTTELAPIEVWAAAWPVERALWAVLDNALRYTPEGGTIRIAVWQGEAYAGVEVTDSGPGIDPEDLPRIFEKFYRGRRSHTQPGSGLGLPIAQALTEREGGFVTVSSPPQGGTVVRLGWRRVRADSPPA